MRAVLLSFATLTTATLSLMACNSTDLTSTSSTEAPQPVELQPVYDADYGDVTSSTEVPQPVELQPVYDADYGDVTSSTEVPQPAALQPVYDDDFMNELPVQCRPLAAQGAGVDVLRKCVDEHYSNIDTGFLN